jgi:hypothetical protein
MFLAQSVEYAGLEYMNVAAALAFGTAIGTVVSVVLAVRLFRRVGALGVALASGCLAGLPFLIDWLLRINHTQLNVHGSAILGYFVYAFGSEACAIGLLSAVALRTFMRSKSRRAV